MKLKKCITLGIGMIAGISLLLTGIGCGTRSTSNSTDIITEEKAKSIMLEKVPEATIVKFSYEKDDITPKYEGTLIKDNYEYDIEINAKTGEITQFEEEKSITNGSTVGSSVASNETTNNANEINNEVTNSSNTTSNGANNSTNNGVNADNNNSIITEEEAKNIMLSKVPNGNIVEFSYDIDDGRESYEGTLIKDNVKYELDVDAKTGEIIKFEQEAIRNSNNEGNSNTQNPSISQGNANTSSYIGEEKAKSIMLEKVPGATFVQFYLDNDETPEYEGELIKDNIEYEISVDAKTGQIIDFSQEPVGR